MLALMRLSKSAEDATVLKIYYGVPVNLENLEKVLGQEYVNRGEVEQTEIRVLRIVNYEIVLERSPAHFVFNGHLRHPERFPLHPDLDCRKTTEIPQGLQDGGGFIPPGPRHLFVIFFEKLDFLFNDLLITTAAQIRFFST